MECMNCMDEKIMVSVYCLAYNHEKYIRDTLEGFVSQITNFRYEVFVHDDASKDRTAIIIKEYADKYPDIIKPIFQVENQYSKGVRIFTTYICPKMTGKYVAICEGDDCWCSSDKLQRQVDILEADENLSACVHQTTMINCMDGTQSEICSYKKSGCVKFEDVIQRGNGVFQISSLMYRRTYLSCLPDFCTSMETVGDYPMSIYLALKGEIYYINETMSVYRMFSSKESWTSVNLRSKVKWVENCKSVIKMLQLADEYSEYKYHGAFMAVIYKYEFDIDKYTKGKYVIFQKKYRNIWMTHRGTHCVKWIIMYLLPGTVASKIRTVKRILKGNRT